MRRNLAVAIGLLALSVLGGRPEAAAVSPFGGSPDGLKPVGYANRGARDPQQSDPPVEVRLAFRALARGGATVPDLAPSDVRVALDGDRRLLTTLTYVAAEPETTTDDTALDAPYVTNATPTPRRELLLYVDEESINPGEHDDLQATLRHLVSQLEPDDRVGLTSTRASGLTVAPTTDRTRITDAIATLQGQRLASNRCNFQDILRGFTSVFRSMANDRPTTIVFASGGVDACNVGGRALLDDLRELGQAAQAASIDMYVLHVIARQGRPPAVEPLQDLAGVTNGEFLRLAAGNVRALDPVVRETAAFYVAEFQVRTSELDESTRRLEVETSRDGVRLRTQRWLRMREAALAAPTVTAVGPVLRSPDDFGELGLRAKTLISPNAGDDRVRLLTLFETTDAAAELSAAMVGVYDANGETVAQWTARAAELTLPSTLAAVVVPAGTYRVRVAAASVDGRVGAVDERVRAQPTQAGPLALSDLVLGREQDGGLGAALEFSTGNVVALGEIYGVPAGTPVKVTMQLLAADGTALATPQTTANQSSDRGRWVAHAIFPIDVLAPGDYRVRAEISLSGSVVGTVTRTLRKR